MNTHKEQEVTKQSDVELESQLRKIKLRRGKYVSKLGGYFCIEDEGIAVLKQLIKDQQLALLDRVEELIDPEPCEPECSNVRHAYHQGQWDLSQRTEESLNTLRKEIKHNG